MRNEYFSLFEARIIMGRSRFLFTRCRRGTHCRRTYRLFQEMTPTTETAETLAREFAKNFDRELFFKWVRSNPQECLRSIEAVALPLLLPTFALLADTQLQLEAIRELADTNSIKRMQARLDASEKALKEDTWKRLESAPRDGTVIEGLYEDGPCLIRWAETRRCMLAGIGGGNGYFGAGWEDDYNHLIADDPIAWREEGTLAKQHLSSSVLKHN